MSEQRKNDTGAVALRIIKSVVLGIVALSVCIFLCREK